MDEEIILPLNKKRCPKGYRRVTGTQKCKIYRNNRKQTLKKNIISDRIEPKDKYTNIDKDNEYTLQPGCKRCKKGYKRLQNTQKCIKKNTNNKTFKQDIKQDVKQEVQEVKKNVIKTNPYPGTEMIRDDRIIIIPYYKQFLGDELKTLTPTIEKYNYKDSVNKTPSKIKIEGYDSGVLDCEYNNEIISDWNNIRELNVKNNSGKCTPANSTSGKNTLLKMLFNKVNPICIIAPKQKLSNCWMNCLFISYFISDLARHHYKWVRKSMITGKDINGKNILNIRKSGLLYRRLNIAIQSCIDCNKELSTLFNTNEVIVNLSKFVAINKTLYRSYLLDTPYITHIHDAGNPRNYFFHIIMVMSGLINQKINKPLKKTHLLPLGFIFEKITEQVYIKDTMYIYYNSTNQIYKNIDLKKLLHLYLIRNSIIDKYKNRITKYIRLVDDDDYNPDSIYKLDSVNLIDNEGQHFVSFITIKNKYYAFDGASYSQLQPFNWMRYLNENNDISFILDNNVSNLRFNFTYGYGEYNYYRI